MSISELCWSVCEIMCLSQNSVGLFVRIGFGRVDRSETQAGFHFEVKFQSLSSLDLLSFDFPHCVLRILNEI